MRAGIAERSMKNGQGFSRLLFDTKGAVAVEFAVVSVFISLLLIGMIDFGIGFWERMLVGNAARAGGEMAMSLGTGYDPTKITNAVTGAPYVSASPITATPAPVEFCGCPSVSGGISNLSTGQCVAPIPCCTPTGGTSGTAPCTAPNVQAATYVTVNAQASYAFLIAYPGISSPLTMHGTMTVRLN
jgi:Flp pilus assembly protein TadG